MHGATVMIPILTLETPYKYVLWLLSELSFNSELVLATARPRASPYSAPPYPAPHRTDFLKPSTASIPKWRETHRAEKNDGCFHFEHLKLCAHIDISYIFVLSVFRGHS